MSNFPHQPIDSELAEEMVSALDECDTAFAVIGMTCELTSQARGCLKEAWHEVQTVMSKLKGPKSAYAIAVEDNRKAGTAP